VCLLKENLPEEVSAFNTEEYWPTSTALYLVGLYTLNPVVTHIA
jgi:hypothetical protein